MGRNKRRPESATVICTGEETPGFSFQSVVDSLEHSALALLSAGKNKLGHAALANLLGTDVDQAASNGSTVIAADTVGGVGAVDGVFARALLGGLAL